MVSHVKTYVTPPPEPDTNIARHENYRLTFGECIAAACAALLIAFFVYCAMH